LYGMLKTPKGIREIRVNKEHIDFRLFAFLHFFSSYEAIIKFTIVEYSIVKSICQLFFYFFNYDVLLRIR
jgi:hypothetical protein